MATSRSPFPLDDDIPDGDYSFTIDFERDTEIVRAYDLKKEMGQYNAEHNAAHNQELGRRQTEERFAQLKGDTWTAQEILDQGFSRKTLDKFVKYGLILRVKKGPLCEKFRVTAGAIHLTPCVIYINNKTHGAG